MNKLSTKFVVVVGGVISGVGKGVATASIGKINVISCARTHGIPYLGLCYGLQLAVVEYARNVCGLLNAHTTEVDPKITHPVVTLLPLQKRLLKSNKFGGTMRLGAYSATIKPDTLISRLYKKNYGTGVGKKIKSWNRIILERHRHRYEINPVYIETLQENGLVFSGYHERIDETLLMEFLELPNHPFFVATQAHPEFKSRLGNPSPLFYGFVKACLIQAENNKLIMKASSYQSNDREHQYF